MRAVIMAGGKGTRLQGLSKEIPKPMFTVLGKPILEYQIENLSKNGIRDITIIVGYLKDIIIEYFGYGEKFGVNIDYIEENEPLGTAGALFFLKEEKNDFLLIFGDLLFDIYFDRFISFHKRKNSLITLFCHPNSHPYDSDVLSINDESMVLEMYRKNKERTFNYHNIVNAGIYCINPLALNDLERLEKKDLEKDLILNLIPKRKVFAYKSTEYVKDMGTPNRLQTVSNDIENGIVDDRCLINKQRAIFLDRDGTINKHVGFLRDAQQFELLPLVPEAIYEINRSRYLAIVITNQPVIARGEVSYKELDDIHKKMDTELGKNGAFLDDLFFCPHHPDKGFEGEIPELKIACGCRKPKIGMLIEASNKHNIDLKESWYIGDTTTDIKTGKNAGMKTILVRTGEAGKDGKYKVTPDYTANNLMEAVSYIISVDKKSENREMNYIEKLNAYREREIEVYNRLNLEEVNIVLNILEKARIEGKRIFICGNGGSAATASHYAGDFNKCVSENLDVKYSIQCLSDNIPTMMAVANDFSYDEVFRYPLINRMNQGDVLIGISGSGNSKNVVNAFEYAKKIGGIVIAIVGYDGGIMKKMADYSIHVDVDDMQISEDIHMVIDHMMVRALSNEQ